MLQNQIVDEVVEEDTRDRTQPLRCPNCGSFRIRVLNLSGGEVNLKDENEVQRHQPVTLAPQRIVQCGHCHLKLLP